jgi:5-amino-6-(5-phosphoribosylamino)uracil reductase
VLPRPYVVLSAAMSADGYLDDATPERLILSGAQDLDRVDELRAGSDAILVGAQTIRSDNPRLLIRSRARQEQRRRAGRPANPLKITLTAGGGLDPAARFFTEADSPPLVYAGRAVAPGLARRLGGGGLVVEAPAAVTGTDRMDLGWILADLAGRGIGRLMVEGGSAVLAGFLSARLADEFSLAVAPVLVGDPRAPRLLAGPGGPGRMELTDVGQAGDMAVLSYRLPVAQADERDR